jgi:hypothetical protein
MLWHNVHMSERCPLPLRQADQARADFAAVEDEFGPHDCPWPHGHPYEFGFGFCGARHHRIERNGEMVRLPYCADHAALAYLRPPLPIG